jgi:hypothetical protein
MLMEFESIARREGMASITTFEVFSPNLFRENVGDHLENPQIRAPLQNTLLTGYPSCYFTLQGFEYSTPSKGKDMRDASKKLLGFTVEEYITLQEGLNDEESPKKWETAKAYLRGNGDDLMTDLFHVVFSKMHASAEKGDDVDRQMLVDIVLDRGSRRKGFVVG